MRFLVSGTTKTLARLVGKFGRQLGFLRTPDTGNSREAIEAFGIPWACDNGCFKGFNEPKFMRMLANSAGSPSLQWVTAPDVVGDHEKTLALFHVWQPVLMAYGVPIAFVAQDGCTELPPEPYAALFIGGSTDWKLGGEAAELCRQAKAAGKQVHMGRVNSVRRMRYARAIGVDTVDGTSVSMFGDVKLPLFVEELKCLRLQGRLF